CGRSAARASASRNLYIGRAVSIADVVARGHIVDLWRGGYRGVHADSLCICRAGIACGVGGDGADGVRAVVDLICRGSEVGGREGEGLAAACGEGGTCASVSCYGDRCPGFSRTTHNHSIGCFVSIDRGVTRDGHVDLPLSGC